jgi:dodecin
MHINSTASRQHHKQDILEIHFLVTTTFVLNMTHVAKIIEIVGSSDKGWEDAAQAAINEARKTIHGITGLEVTDMTAKVDPGTGNIAQYRATVKIAFGVEH